MLLREVRNERGVTQKQLADALGTDVPQISRYENYKCLPVPADMEIICDLLNCEVNDIYDDKEIVYHRKKKQAPSGEYKVTVRLPADAKDEINRALITCHYVGVSDWVRACYRRLIAQAEIIRKEEAKLSKSLLQRHNNTNSNESQEG